jgi:Xaa-Pro aminopeptidase
MNKAQKLEKLRHEMAQQGVQGYLVPRTDEYQGEYVAAYAERLAWLTGFTGSAGLAIILEDKAMVMSDGRYTIQLAQQVDKDLYSLGNSQEVKLEDWLQKNAKENIIGYDPKLFTPLQIDKLKKAGVSLKAIDRNLIDEIWEDQPLPPKGALSLFNEKFAGQSLKEKVTALQNQLKEEGATAVILTLSDSIAWLLNIRGSDIPFIPIALCYAIVPDEGKVQLFIDQEKITNEVQVKLQDHVEFLDEGALEKALQNLKDKVWLDTKRSSIWFKNQLQDILEKDDPCILPRACKNEDEQEAMKNAHIRDGVAFIKFLKWFQESNESQTEISIEKKLEAFRAEVPEFKEPSFSTIAGFGSNGAIVHYRATEETSKNIEGDSLLLIDSGAQYEDGTTDITRTLPVGEPTQEMKERYTLVLKGHIALASAKFKKGTTGLELDTLARAPLVKEGLNYAHGTGHGVGCYLSVHEEAANISPKSDKELMSGMILSNEPGYYKEGEYGIRIENLILTKEDQNGDLYFETITLAPIDKMLIVKEMMSVSEIEWLNNYHAQVYQTISPLLGDSTKAWLKEVTSKL